MSLIKALEVKDILDILLKHNKELPQETLKLHQVFKDIQDLVLILLEVGLKVIRDI